MTATQTVVLASDAEILQLVNAHNVETWFVSPVGASGEELPTYSSAAFHPRFGFRAAFNSAKRGAVGRVAAVRVVVRYTEGTISAPMFARSSVNDGTCFDDRAW